MSLEVFEAHPRPCLALAWKGPWLVLKAVVLRWSWAVGRLLEKVQFVRCSLRVQESQTV